MIEQMGIKYERWHVGIHAVIEDDNFSTRIESDVIEFWINVLRGDSVQAKVSSDITIKHRSDHTELKYFRYRPRYMSETYILKIPQDMANQIADDLEDMKNNPIRKGQEAELKGIMKRKGKS
jgi:hypothetical protein